MFVLTEIACHGNGICNRRQILLSAFTYSKNKVVKYVSVAGRGCRNCSTGSSVVCLSIIRIYHLF